MRRDPAMRPLHKCAERLYGDRAGYFNCMVTQLHSTAWDMPTWDSSETICDGCHQRVASGAARMVSYGAVAPDDGECELPKVFHGPECAIEYRERVVLEVGLADL
jgi:hypothetical protein